MKFSLTLLFTGLLPFSNLFAGSATWNLNPTSSDWNTAANWTPATVPNGPFDVATFASSNQPAISLSADIEINEIICNSGAPQFAIDSVSTAILTISGAGITNNSGITQQFVVDQNENGDSDGLRFTNNATAGTNTMLIAMPGVTSDFGTGGAILFEDESSADHSVIQVFGQDPHAFREGELTFFDNSTAGDATISTLGVSGGYVGALTFVGASTAGNATINNGRSGRFGGFFYFWNTAAAGTSEITNHGYIVFRDSASLDQATITNVPGATNGIYTGLVEFWLTSTAGSGTIINQGGAAAGTNGAMTNLIDQSTGGSATLIAEAGTNGGGGGLITFGGTSNGGNVRVEVFGNGSLDISPRALPGTTVGSLEGDGLVLLGANALTIGSNNLSTTFSGVISDSGLGSLIKTGNGKLTLSGANTYTGGTTIDGGTLYVTNRSSSSTGSGAVQVDAGKLGGTGRLAGAVTIGDGHAPEAYLTPGIAASRPATLTIRNTVTFQADGTLHFGYKSNGTGDRVVARGVTIQSGAELFFGPIDTGTITVGTIFTVINNTAATQINGTFSNLPDGGTITVGNNTFQANYEGGDGNDLTLTVQ
jgi:autotransporter-associated beta strand protein